MAYEVSTKVADVRHIPSVEKRKGRNPKEKGFLGIPALSRGKTEVELGTADDEFLPHMNGVVR